MGSAKVVADTHPELPNPFQFPKSQCFDLPDLRPSLSIFPFSVGFRLPVVISSGSTPKLPYTHSFSH